MPEPRCFGSIVRLTREAADDRNRILFSNPDVFDSMEEHVIEWGDRRDVTVRLSYDECESWPVKRRLEDGPSGYSDLAVLPDKTILCIYERGRIEDGNTACNRFMTLARFDLDWLTAGRDTSAT